MIVKFNTKKWRKKLERERKEESKKEILSETKRPKRWSFGPMVVGAWMLGFGLLVGLWVGPSLANWFYFILTN